MRKFFVIPFLFILCHTGLSIGAPASTPATPSAGSKCVIYFAAPLFSLSEKRFNNDLVSFLEKNYSYTILLPQRDGFEFDVLDKLFVQQHLDPREAVKAEQLIIYYYDMGYLIPKSNIIVAILDEPLDPGVMVEITYAHLIGKPVIGIRTDVRSPFGLGPELSVHLFSLFQLTDYYFLNKIVESTADIENAEKIIAGIIHEKIDHYQQANYCSNNQVGALLNNPVTQDIQRGAQLLFGGMTLKEINSDAGMKIIVKKYMENRQELGKIYPFLQLNGASTSENK